ncbi:MAG: DoxX family protein [Pseudolabrys sp.]
MFVSSGVENFMDLGATTSAIASKSLPYANVLAVLTAIVEAGGGLLIIFGWQTRLAATGARDLLRRRGLLLP